MWTAVNFLIIHLSGVRQDPFWGVYYLLGGKFMKPKNQRKKYKERHPNNLDWPATLEDAVEKLLIFLDTTQKDKLREISKEDLVCDFGLLMWVRNQFGLWAGNKKLLEDCAIFSNEIFVSDKELFYFISADEASGIILEQTWKKLQDEQT